MNLYITNREIASLCGVHVRTEYMGANITHLALASQNWDKLYIDVDECIPEGFLRRLRQRCKSIIPSCPDKPSLHQLHLLVELFPELNGQLRKAYMKGGGVSDLLPEMWEHGSEAGRNAL